MIVALSARVFLLRQEVRDFTFTRSSSADIDDTDEEILARMINAICDAVVSYIGLPVIKDAALTYVDDGGWPEIILPHYPINAVSKVTDSVLGDYASDLYKVSKRLGVIQFADGSDWPDVLEGTTVIYSAGWGTQTTVNNEPTAITGVPEDIRLAAMYWVRETWRNGPENFTEATSYSGVYMPRTTKSLLDRFVRYNIGIG